MTLYEGPASAVIERIVADATEALARGQRVGILAADEDIVPDESDTLRVARLGRQGDKPAVAANLYNALRTLMMRGGSSADLRG
jgi:hypothetical protein